VVGKEALEEGRFSGAGRAGEDYYRRGSDCGHCAERYQSCSSATKGGGW
jgi:hypothetical protein